MTAETVAPDPERGVSPGTCSEHGRELVDHRSAGLRWFAFEDPATVCPAADHPELERERCRWCGGPLFDLTLARWRQSDRRTYCKPLCRLHAHRARIRAEKGDRP
jgi:hypothetical protein